MENEQEIEEIKGEELQNIEEEIQKGDKSAINHIVVPLRNSLLSPEVQ